MRNSIKDVSTVIGGAALYILSGCGDTPRYTVIGHFKNADTDYTVVCDPQGQDKEGKGAKSLVAIVDSKQGQEIDPGMLTFRHVFMTNPDAALRRDSAPSTASSARTCEQGDIIGTYTQNGKEIVVYADAQSTSGISAAYATDGRIVNNNVFLLGQGKPVTRGIDATELATLKAVQDNYTKLSDWSKKAQETMKAQKDEIENLKKQIPATTPNPTPATP